MGEFLKLMVLSVLQGVTEFLPVSSSGHLVLMKCSLGVEAPGESLEVLLHFATMLTILAFYRRELSALICGMCRLEAEAWRMALSIVVSALPAMAVYFTCKEQLEVFFQAPARVGALLCFTGVVLISLKFTQTGEKGVSPLRAFLIGLAQAVALLPGVSRSGSTIAAARALGVKPEKAASFSFLMCLPLLAGASLLGALGELSGESGAALTEMFPLWMLVASVAITAVVGYLSLALLVKMLRSGAFWMFGVYCLLAGLATLAVAG